MVIDGHVHLVLKRESRSCADEAIGDFCREMDRCGIDRACIMQHTVLSGKVVRYADEAEVRDRAETMADIGSRYRDRIYTNLYMNPNHRPEFVRELCREYFARGRIDGAKIACEMSPSDERFEPLARLLDEHAVPVLIHTFLKSTSFYPFEALPSEIAGLARRHPQLRIVMPHLVGCRFRGVEEVADCANVWVDTSGNYAERGHLEHAVRVLGPDRIIFGSDYYIRDMAVQKHHVLGAEIDDAVKDKILSANFLGMMRGAGR
jgi:uncharacterized protein